MNHVIEGVNIHSRRVGATMQQRTRGFAAAALLMSAVPFVAAEAQFVPPEAQAPSPRSRLAQVNDPRQKVGRETTTELAHGQPTGLPELSDSEIAGLPKGVQPQVLTWDRIYALALVRVRTRRGAFSPTLDPAALEQEALRLGVADFARFRINFHSNGPFHDPGPTVLELLGRRLAIENAGRNVSFLEGLHRRVIEQSRDGSSGLTGLNADTVEAAVLRASASWADEVRRFRDGLDEIRFLLGLSPRAPVILDRQNLNMFPGVFDSVDKWSSGTNRKTQELVELVERLPDPGEVVVDRELILAKIETNPDRGEEFLAKAAQLALRSRSERDQIPTQPNSGVQLELRVRRQIRDLLDKRRAYQAEKRRYVLATRLKDAALERLTAPAPAAAGSRAPLLEAVLEGQADVVDCRARLITIWTSFRAGRLALYHDLGVLPYPDWKSFLGDLGARPVGPADAGPSRRAIPPDGDAPRPQALPGTP